MSSWLLGHSWEGTVTLDGVDVSARCLGVHLDEGRPVAVLLASVNAQGQMYLIGNDVATELRRGAIGVHLTLRLYQEALALGARAYAEAWPS